MGCRGEILGENGRDLGLGVLGFRKERFGGTKGRFGGKWLRFGVRFGDAGTPLCPCGEMGAGGVLQPHRPKSQRPPRLGVLGGHPIVLFAPTPPPPLGLMKLSAWLGGVGGRSNGAGGSNGGVLQPHRPKPQWESCELPPPPPHTHSAMGRRWGGGNEAVQRRFLGRPEEAGVGLKPKGRHGARAGERR